jgi:hypothetical protein
MKPVAKIRGIPASVTSTGPGRSFSQGIPASVTSLGPHGFNGNPAGVPNGVRFSQVPTRRFDFDRDRDRRFHRPIVAVPVYVYPYGYSYPYGYDSSIQTQQYDPAPTYVSGADNDRPAQYDAADNSRYGDHYLDSREGDGRSSVRVLPGPKYVAPEPRRAEPEPQEDVPATLLVFKDGHQVEVHNYAIIGSTLWDLSDHLTKKISLADLDLAATTKVNDERGTPFKLPKKS